ncbi:STAS domain-containing protein [Virgibacillus necropolis]|uniref:STAS domain-containing protein n=1 Tax=Virgibacillus necropolis TaxID=163877 RepID=UPI0013747ADE|nr:STAS domain-containing protein [Virgibacillus necropolis]
MIAALPIIGKIDQSRAEMITGVVLKESQRLKLEHLVIDLSGVHAIESEGVHALLYTVNTLKLLGVDTVFTGIHPELALKASSFGDLNNATYCANLEQALTSLGFKFSR